MCYFPPDFERLVDRLVGYVKQKYGVKQDKWITATRMLNISSKTTLQALLNTGKFCFSQQTHKILLDFLQNSFEL